MNPKVDEYLGKALKWPDALNRLRAILLECGLVEDYKWRQPCYTYNNKIILVLSEFKDYCALNFFKGSLLADTHTILVKPGENTQGGRQMRFTSVKEINRLESVIKSYIFEAIEVENAGLKVDSTTIKEIDLPMELEQMFNENIDFKNAFYRLTPGRQRAYLMHFSGAKQSKTITDRIENYTQRILNGKGMNDCVCGKSKRMPNCDGSHKYL